MATFEIDVELRVRKTLCFTGPLTEEAAREIIKAILSDDGGIGLWPLQKKENDGASFPMPRPVEVVTDNDPQIVAVRRVG